MRTLITIDYLSVNGINPDRPDLDRKLILDSLEKTVSIICNELGKFMKSKKIITKIVHISE